MEDASTGVIPLPQRKPTLRDMVSALTVRNYRIYAIAQILALTAVWTQRVAQDWILFQLTGNVSTVGFLVVMQFGPVLLFGMIGGVIVDRYSKRALILISQTVVVLAGAALAILAFTDRLEAWHIFALAGLVGLCSVVDQPARQVFVSELVGRQLLSNAVSTNSAIFQTSALIGPAVAGIMLANWGGGWAFLVTAIGASLSLVLLILINTADLTQFPTAPRQKGQAREALAYVRRKPVIFWTLILLVFVAGIGMNWSVLLAPMAEHVFDSGAQGYGSYNSAIATGALIGAILSMRRMGVRLRTFYTAVIGFTSLKLASAFMPLEWAFMATIALAGLWSVLMWTAANALIQTSSNMLIRGRVMSIYLLISVGGQALGGPLLGTLVDLWGARVGLIISGAVPLTAALVIGFIVTRVHRVPMGDLLPFRGGGATAPED